MNKSKTKRFIKSNEISSSNNEMSDLIEITNEYPINQNHQ